jgi:opacity protein-like surface antigen
MGSDDFPLRFGATAGVTFAIASEWVDTGYQLGVSVQDRGVQPFGWRVEADFARADGASIYAHNSQVQRHVYSLMGDAVWTARARLRPYLFVGGGAGRVDASALGFSLNFPAIPISDSQTVAGFRFGGGLALSSSRPDIAVELRYMTLSTRWGDRNLIPDNLTFGTALLAVRF